MSSPRAALSRACAAAPWALLLGGLYAAPSLVHDRYLLSVATLVLFRVLLVSSLRLNHLMGYVSLGHVGFMLVGAYTSALAVLRLGAPIGVGLLGAAVVPFGLAWLLGYPFLRVKGLYFVILTFLVAETLRLVATYATDVTGGASGLSEIPPLGALSLGPVHVSLESGQSYYVFLLTVVLCVSAGLRAIEHSRLGFYWRAIQQSEILCASAGVNTTLLKTANFALAAAIAGLTGGLWAHYETVLTPSFTSVFGAMSSMLLLAYLYVGGKEHFAGPALGVLLLTSLAEAARVEETYVPMLTGAAMILVMLFFPEGVGGALQRARTRWGGRWATS